MKFPPFTTLRRLWNNRSLRTKGFVVISIPLVAMLGGNVSSFLINRAQDAASLAVDRSLLVHAEADHLLETYLHAETAACGYALTHTEEFHAPYRAARQTLPQTVARLENLVQNEPTQVARLRRVQAVLAQNVAQLAAMTEGTEHAAAVAAGSPLVVADNQSRTDALRREVGALDGAEQRLLGTRRAHLARTEQWRTVGDFGEVIVGLLGACAAMQLFSSGIIRRVRHLQENADRLAEGAPPIAKPMGGDEIGTLARHLEEAGDLLRERGQALDDSVAQLRRSESLHQALTRHFPNGSVYVFDHALRYLLADGTGLAETGPRRELLEGRTLQEGMPPDTAATMEPLYRAALAGEFQNLELPYNGRVYDLQTLPLRDEHGAVFAGLAVTQDITARKRDEELLRQARDEAERANLAKSEFLSRMSHELRTPLNAILGFGQLIEMEAKTDHQHEHVEHILKGGRHLLGLINEVLDIARIESGHMQLSLEAVRVADLVAESLDMVRPLAAARRITLVDEATAASVEEAMQADQQRLRQVLLNLLSNAVKYNREAGRVTVRRVESPREGFLRLEVRDTGPGMNAGQLARLFTAFDRLGAERSRIEGTGLGLALSRQLVEAMGGALGVESTVGEGSAFWVELPQADTPAGVGSLWPEGHWLAGREDGAATAPEPKPTPGRTLLYIEDNLSNLQLVEYLLSYRAQTRLLSALQGSMGLELAREHRPDLILLDVHLPDLSGHEVLLRLRAEEGLKDVPVIVMSADATAGQIARLTAAGANAYLTKPFQVPEFFRLVDELTASRV